MAYAWVETDGLISIGYTCNDIKKKIAKRKNLDIITILYYSFSLEIETKIQKRLLYKNKN